MPRSPLGATSALMLGLGLLGGMLLGVALADAGPPDEPSVVEMDGHKTVGKPGGQLDMLVGRAKDTRLMVVYGYARLVAYNEALELEPDILKDVEVEDGRIFTLHLRPGHRWSDGEPFTSEDFRYWWEDVANNAQLSPTGPPAELFVDGEAPKVEFLDPLTVRYSWSKPNPFFLPALAGATPTFIYMPAHYLRQFHEKYADPDQLAAKVQEAQARDWAQLHGRKDGMYAFDNPDLPTLQPWRPTTPAPANRFVFERNEYFHRVDPNGQQLPYIDRVVLDVVDDKLIPVKTGAGETDLQSRGLFFKHYTFLKESQARSHLDTYLWETAQGAHVAIYPNLNTTDEVWRKLFRDVRFRRALSLAVDRDEINQIMYFGLAIGGGNTVLPKSPLYKPEYRDTWAQYDLEQANALLDEIGLTERSKDGLRLLPPNSKGERDPMEIIVETAGEESEQSDILELVEESWLQLGIRIHTKPSQREVFRNRVFAGDALMSIWFGLENGIPTAEMSPSEFAPTSQQQLQWPKWGQYYETKGAAGEPPDEPEAKKLLELFTKWRGAHDSEERAAIWHEILALYSDQVYSIGLISGVLQPVAVRQNLHNVPKEAVYNWEPGAQFGVYRPDTFWFDQQ
jgi:peptide/nickel transport system substrate-binding protein